VLTPLDPLLSLAARNHGLVTRAQAADLQISTAALDKRVRDGRLLVVHRGVYRAAGAPVTWSSRLLAACLATGGVASHRSAATLLGVRDARRGPPEVTTERALRSRQDVPRIHRSRDLHKATLLTIDGIPTTAPSRLAVDLGAVWPEPRVEGALHDLVARGQLSWDDVAVAVMRHSRRGRDGVGVARRIVERRIDGLVGDSVLESLVLAMLFDAGLPTPQTQVEIFDGDGFIARVDVAWVDRGVIVEADSLAFHLTGDAFQADKAKRNRLRVAGWFVHEVTWEMCMDHGARTVAEIRSALDARPPGSFGATPYRSGVIFQPSGP